MILVVHLHVNYRQEILIFGCNVYIKAERGHLVTLERSSITDCTTNVLSLGSDGFFFFFNFFFFLVHYQMTTEL